ncbi:hypothetical protein SYNPS1DRAFT_23656 [Syncephalis pseudoplumigaleata]|uniref:RRM domain-containing protein n=1 Tax=Syncephalis pseudoplumigaleata TaxID=1712513 RepID=A0A4P9YWF4_9FUNG|nr:hypothetical protein SYNPS1DRAFT_23656 [Syncephalis pseudoplumigaleata]|eukprot:RKP24254.1 hypothetical protein SYNPS1DRAFT_23656 [Syncephalis pseudoplumigaleata]
MNENDLPRYLTEERLREHFAAQGEVTDVRLMRTAKGVSRRFAFIGYKTEQEAHKAIAHFHGTFIDTSRIVVEQAKSAGNAARDDARLQEFLQVMQPRIKSKAWDNEDGRIVEARPSTVQRQKAKNKTTDVIAVPNKKPGGGGMLVKKMHTKFESDSEESAAEEKEEEEEEEEDMMMVLPAQDSVAHNAAVSNLDYLRSKMVLRTDMEAVRGWW